MTNPHSNIQIQLASRWDHEFLLTQYCLFTKRAGFILHNFNRSFHFLSSQNLLIIIIYLSLFFFFFVFTAAVKYNWLKMWGNVPRSTYSWLNSVPIEINGIISVATSRSRVKPTPIALQSCLLKNYVTVCNQGRYSSKNEPTH